MNSSNMPANLLITVNDGARIMTASEHVRLVALVSARKIQWNYSMGKLASRDADAAEKNSRSGPMTWQPTARFQ